MTKQNTISKILTTTSALAFMAISSSAFYADASSRIPRGSPTGAGGGSPTSPKRPEIANNEIIKDAIINARSTLENIKVINNAILSVISENRDSSIEPRDGISLSDTATLNLIATSRNTRVGHVSTENNANSNIIIGTNSKIDEIINTSAGAKLTIYANGGDIGELSLNGGGTSNNTTTTMNIIQDSKVEQIDGILDQLTFQGNTGANLTIGNNTATGIRNVNSVTEDNTLGNIHLSGNNPLIIHGDHFEANVYSGSADANAQGVIVFNSKVSPIGTFNATNGGNIHTVGISGKDADVTLGDSLVNVSLLVFDHKDSRASVSSVGNPEMRVVSTKDNYGNLTFNNDDKDITVDSIGAEISSSSSSDLEPGIYSAGEINITGTKNVTSGDSFIKKLNFGTPEGSNTPGHFGTKKLDHIEEVTTSKDGTGVLVFLENTKLPSDIGTKDASIKKLIFAPANKTAGELDLDGTQVFNAAIESKFDDTLTVFNIGSDTRDTHYSRFGTEDKYLSALSFSETGEQTTNITEEVYAKNIIVNKQSNIIFSKSLYGKGDKDSIQLGNLDSKLVFKDNASIINTDVVAKNSGDGKLAFEGNTSIGKIGSDGKNIRSIEFTGKNSTVSLRDDIYSNEIKLGASCYNVDATLLKLTGDNIEMTQNTIFALGANSAILYGGVNANNHDITIQFDLVDNNISNYMSLQGILSNPGKFTFDLGNKLMIRDVTTSGYVEAIDIGKLANNITITSTNKLVRYKVTPDGDNKIHFTSYHDTEGFSNNIKLSGGTDNAIALADKLFDATPGTTAWKLLELVSDSEANIDYNKSAEAMNRVSAPSSSGIDSQIAASDISRSLVTSRLSSISTQMSGDAGISSGDGTNSSIGVWGSVAGMIGSQKMRKSDPGFKTTASGMTIGVDTMISDSAMIGASATYAGTSIKYKDYAAGDKTKSTNLVFSIYGTTDLPYNTFLRGSATFGSGKSKAYAKRVISQDEYDTATAKFDTTSYSLESLTGYKHELFAGTNIVPMVGLRYESVLQGGYSETGSMFNRTVSKSSSSKLTGIVGLGLENNIAFGEYALALEAHTYGNYDFTGHNPKQSIDISGAKTINISSSKPTKFSTTLGLGACVKTSTLEYGATYDAKLSTKFASHQGSLKLKINL